MDYIDALVQCDNFYIKEIMYTIVVYTKRYEKLFAYFHEILRLNVCVYVCVTCMVCVKYVL